MLNKDRAEKLLKQFEVAQGRQRRIGRVRALPDELQKLAQALLKASTTDSEDVLQSARKALALPEAERRRIWEALLPAAAQHVEAALSLIERSPYQGGYERRSFRAPRHPAETLQRKFEWINAMVLVDQDYCRDAAWYAAWAPYVSDWDNAIGKLLAAAIETGGPEGNAVFDALVASALGEHEIGGMGAHVVAGLLMSSRQDGWVAVEKVLLAAQRQEGVRQAIVECADLAHPEAFVRLLRVILDHDLARFSSVVRAADVWFATQWTAPSARDVQDAIKTVLRFLDDPGEARLAIADGPAREAYFGLWATAFVDAYEAIEAASSLLRDADAERRFAAVWLLRQTEVAASAPAALPAVYDSDLRVAWVAFSCMSNNDNAVRDEELAGAFDAGERLLARLPQKPEPSDPIVFPWLTVSPNRQQAAAQLAAVCPVGQPERMLPYIPMLDTWEREEAVKRMAKRLADPTVRAFLVTMAGDPAAATRAAALKALDKVALTDDEACSLESLLTRKASDLRHSVIARLLKQSDAAASVSAARLSAAGAALQRQAGEEMRAVLTKAGRLLAATPGASGAPPASEAPAKLRAAKSPAESSVVEPVGTVETEAPGPASEAAGIPAEWTAANGFGLFDPAERTPPVEPKIVPGIELTTDASALAVCALGQLAWEHREEPARGSFEWGEDVEAPLGDDYFPFPEPRPELALEADLARMPLADVWMTWWRERPADLRDPDGMEILRMMALWDSSEGYASAWSVPVGDGKKSVKLPQVVRAILPWLLRACPPEGAPGFLVDALATSFALIPSDVVKRPSKGRTEVALGWRRLRKHTRWVSVVADHVGACGSVWTSDHWRRLWALLRFQDEPGPGMPRCRPTWDLTAAAFGAGAATRADVIDHLLGPRHGVHEASASAGLEQAIQSIGGYEFRSGTEPWEDLETLTALGHRGKLAAVPGLLAIVNEVRDRIVEIEVSRGELPTPLSLAARALGDSGGADTLIRVLTSPGFAGFSRTGYDLWDSSKAAARPAVLTHLVTVARPGPDDTPDRVRLSAQSAAIPASRLVEAALLAPQWAEHAEAAVGWPGLADAAWWLHAHTRDAAWASGDQRARDEWAGRLSRKTPLAGQDLLDGAVDVDWFRSAYGRLGEERWDRLDKAAKFASTGGGHRRAQTFADAMRGRLTKEQILERIRDKRNQDAVRALGLVPLAEADGRTADVLDRYLALQEFLRQSREFGSIKQASERLAVAIAMQNLARSAGYADPVRLEWAMERAAVEDLRAGAVEASAGEITVRLSLDPWGRPRILFLKGGLEASSLPAAAKKDAGIAGILERENDVRKQASRMRRSLEEAMCRGDRFNGAELRELMEHPILAPMLRSLVFAGEGGWGYLVDGGAALESHDGSVVVLPPGGEVRLAHPVDLLAGGQWHLWQRECFARERIQPFKQVFRELYVLTDSERQERTQSRRYAGHQVNPRQAVALLGQRGWVNDPDEGPRKTFHRLGLVARLVFDVPYWSPAEVEAPTVETVEFVSRSDGKQRPLDEAPPIVFSEVMRDVDLMVSVAHVGGVDPEATASTIEMRASVVRETCSLLGLGNVSIEGNFVRVAGALTRYSVHLGSAAVNQSAGGQIVIVAVRGEHRGRLFLPFLDDDPRTAEVMSKVLLLARDDEIRDPSILAQIMR